MSMGSHGGGGGLGGSFSSHQSSSSSSSSSDHAFCSHDHGSEMVVGVEENKLVLTGDFCTTIGITFKPTLLVALFDEVTEKASILQKEFPSGVEKTGQILSKSINEHNAIFPFRSLKHNPKNLLSFVINQCLADVASVGSIASSSSSSSGSEKPSKKGSSKSRREQSLTIVTPCGFDFCETSIVLSSLAQLSGTNYVLKNIFNRGIACVAGVLGRLEIGKFDPIPAREGLGVGGELAASGKGKGYWDDAVALFLHVERGVPGRVMLEAALIKCEAPASSSPSRSAIGSSDDVSVGGYDRMYTLAAGSVEIEVQHDSHKVGAEEAGASLENALRSLLASIAGDSEQQGHLEVLLKCCVLEVSASEDVDAVVGALPFLAGKGGSNASSSYVSVLSGMTRGSVPVMRAVKGDAEIGGALLSAAELDSSKTYEVRFVSRTAVVCVWGGEEEGRKEGWRVFSGCPVLCQQLLYIKPLISFNCILAHMMAGAVGGRGD